MYAQTYERRNFAKNQIAPKITKISPINFVKYKTKISRNLVLLGNGDGHPSLEVLCPGGGEERMLSGGSSRKHG
jgi:hypothetical protein